MVSYTWSQNRLTGSHVCLKMIKFRNRSKRLYLVVSWERAAGLVFVGVLPWLYLPPLCPSGIWKGVAHSAKYKRCNVSFTSNGKYFSHSSKISGSRLVFLRHVVQALENVWNRFWPRRPAVGVEVSMTNFRPLMSVLPNDWSYSGYTALYYRSREAFIDTLQMTSTFVCSLK